MSSSATRPFVPEAQSLQQAGIGNDAIEAWRTSAPLDTGDFTGDCARYAPFWAASAAMLARLPAKPARNTEQVDAAEHIKRVAREARTRFLSAHAGAVYDRLTRSRTRFVRVEQLIYDAAVLVPGLTPTQAQVDAESALMQRDKEGYEVDQGIFVSRVLADARSGTHLCHAMLLPRTEAVERLSEFQKKGRLDLGAAEIFRKGRASH